MIIGPPDSLETVFSKVRYELSLGVSNNNHPFRYGCLATYSQRGAPGLRYIVLRKIVSELNLVFFTDKRSAKVKQMERQPELSILFYHPHERLQVRVSGKAIIHGSGDLVSQYWSTIARTGWKQYSSLLSPGEKIQHPEDAFSWAKLARWKYFVVVEVIAGACEVLQLNRDEHMRAFYEKSSGIWTSSWLSP